MIKLEFIEIEYHELENDNWFRPVLQFTNNLNKHIRVKAYKFIDNEYTQLDLSLIDENFFRWINKQDLDENILQDKEQSYSYLSQLLDSYKKTGEFEEWLKLDY